MKKEKKPIPVYPKPEPVKCENCGKEFQESDYALLVRFIMGKKPACSHGCNKALGQTDLKR